VPCGVCTRGARYAFAGPAGERVLRCTRHAIVYPGVRDRALQVAAVVGLVLFAINQLDIVMQGGLTALVAGKVVLTFAVPFSVSTYSALQVSRLG